MSVNVSWNVLDKVNQYGHPVKLMPWEQLPKVWKTKAMYFQWLRGQMRKAWSRHPVKIAYKNSRRTREAVGKKLDKSTGKPALVWALPCDQCGFVFPQGEVEVDHIIRAGSFREWEDCEHWLMSLMQISFDDLQLLCKPCHKIKSYAETHNMTFGEATAQKAAIKWLKDNTPAQQIKFLLSKGCSAAECKTLKMRRMSYVYYFNTLSGTVA